MAHLYFQVNYGQQTYVKALNYSNLSIKSQIFDAETIS